jgi:hypothetical protein
MNIREEELYKQKYLKYKGKYLAAKQIAGAPVTDDDVRAGENQLIGLVTDIHHPNYHVTTNRDTYKTVLRAGVTHKIKKDETKKERKIVKNETYVLIQPGVSDYGRQLGGDIVKIFSPKEGTYLLLNEKNLLAKGFIPELLYRGAHDAVNSSVVFVDKDPHKHAQISRPGGREFPSDSEDDLDEDMQEAIFKHASTFVDPSSDEDYFVQPQPQSKSKSKPKTDHPSSKLDIDLHKRIEGSVNPYLPHPEISSGVAASTHKWGQSRTAPSAESRWGQSRAAPSAASAASRWEQQRGTDTTRPWDQLRTLRGEPEHETPSD